MTIDESYNTCFGKPYIVPIDEHEEAKRIIRNAIEEVKQYREIGTVEECKNSVLDIERAYNKAIDDFVKFANTMPTVKEENGTIRPMWLEEMAERLKEGASNGTDNQ